MTLIDQLEQTVTPAVLGADNNMAHISLLEQFYAILASRLATPEIYTQLVQERQNLPEPASGNQVLFEQLWQQPSQRKLLVQELSAAHHVDELATESLLVSAAHLGYQELKNAAKGQYLPAFLQAKQADVRPYLPVWASAVVSPVVAVADDAPSLTSSVATDAALYDNHDRPSAAAAEQTHSADAVPVIVDSEEPPATDAIHANPSAHHTPEGLSAVRRRNQRNDLVIRLLLLGGVLVAMGVVWALFFRQEPAEPAPPVMVDPAPVVAPAEPVPEPVVLTPAELSIAVDDQGNLYSCSATVGDAALQGALMQALASSFGDQSSMCNIRVQEGVATTLSDINVATLPQALTFMRTAPFSRFELRNDAVTIEAPDNMLLQHLVGNMRTILPSTNIIAAEPIAIAQPPANTYDETYNNGYNNDGYDNSGTYNNGVYNNSGSMPNSQPNIQSAPITNDGGVISNQPQQVPNTGVNPSPNYNNRVPSIAPQDSPTNSGTSNNLPAVNQNNVPTGNNNVPTGSNNVPVGGISPAEADAMANNVIVAEPAQVNRPAN